MKALSLWKWLLVAIAVLMLAMPAKALIDSNTNGMSDVWEKLYNGGNLFSPINPAQAPTADPDKDGWTNADEAAAGTNPANGIPPLGIVPLSFIRVIPRRRACFWSRGLRSWANLTS